MLKKNKFSEKLIELRKGHKYTQKFVAEKLKITPRMYGYCESGHFPTSANLILDICKLYNIDANELFDIQIKYILPDNSTF